MLAMLADIASGHTAAADVCFLIGLALAVLATLAAWPRPATAAAGWTPALASGALAALALGWLLL